ncbi:MAG TPA: terpene cyclase/mutase family protein [Tenuifilaceae bacterium]|nr:terpene cyclase/mutase family protein [Tenuifilaceae bacterium]HQG18374.1 terpene cyclase/mutase family protein [Tenuifilaceae bacterium]HQI58616.1 terpene cyclase/mutase family protein [Tenuifilaceae bacterium]
MKFEFVESAVNYILSLKDNNSGGFLFSKGNKPTLMGTSYAIHALEFFGALNRISEIEKSDIVKFLMSGCLPDGSFRDPLFDPASIVTKQHDESYFDGETTCFVQNALDALGAPPPTKRIFPEQILTVEGLRSEFDSYNWRDPHLNSNRVMFWLAQFVHEVERHKSEEYLPLIDAGLDWIDENQSPSTGLWAGPFEVSLSAAMAATFHFTFFYFYRNRPLKFVERIIDSCIELQRKDGLFSRGNEIGQTCLDYDAIDLLAKASLITDYRSSDIRLVFDKAAIALQNLWNDDGGVAENKEAWKGEEKIKINKLYHTGLEICSCKNSDSNAFSTWFRSLTYVLCLQDEWVHKVPSHPQFIFRRLPWLGYHNVEAIKVSNNNNKVKRVKIGIPNINSIGGKINIDLNKNNNIAHSNGLYLLELKNKIDFLIIKVSIAHSNNLKIRLSYQTKDDNNKHWHSMVEVLENNNSNAYFIIHGDLIIGDIFMDVYGTKLKGTITELSIFSDFNHFFK